MKVIKILQQLIIIEVSLKNLKQIKIRQCFSSHKNREINHPTALAPISVIPSNMALTKPLSM